MTWHSEWQHHKVVFLRTRCVGQMLKLLWSTFCTNNWSNDCVKCERGPLQWRTYRKFVFQHLSAHCVGFAVCFGSVQSHWSVVFGRRMQLFAVKHPLQATSPVPTDMGELWDLTGNIAAHLAAKGPHDFLGRKSALKGDWTDLHLSGDETNDFELLLMLLCVCWMSKHKSWLTDSLNQLWRCSCVNIVLTACLLSCRFNWGANKTIESNDTINSFITVNISHHVWLYKQTIVASVTSASIHLKGQREGHGSLLLTESCYFTATLKQLKLDLERSFLLISKLLLWRDN